MKNAGLLSAFLLLMGAATFSVHAEEASSSTTATDQVPATEPAPQQPEAAAPADAAREVLKQHSDDATSEKNLEQVFQASEKTYSLLKTGKVSMLYDVDYSYYRDLQLDLATASNSSQITRFRIQDDAQHTINNSLEVSYGVKDNLTFAGSLPLVSKFDSQKDLQVTGLGDMSLSLRWQPIPLKRGLPTTTLFASLSTATGDSPYEINVNQDLATGKGYYSLSGGASISKLADPIVLFASGSYTVGSTVGGLNQSRGGRILDSVEPGDTLGASMGLAYSLNYDVSVTASYQQSFSLPTTYRFTNGEFVSTAIQSSGSLSFSVGLRTNPNRIVNISLGYGLTEDTPDITLGFSMPIDFLGVAEE